MDFVATSEPHQDLVSGFWDSTGTGFFDADTPTSSVTRDNTSSTTGLADDIVSSSQPFEDGEEDLLPIQKPLLTYTPLPMASTTGVDPASSPRARRARLVRRASPVKPRAVAPADLHCMLPHPRKLVRRVTFTAELERRRRRARIEARHIFKKLQALTTTVHHLKRKHRELRMLGAGTSAHNSENSVSTLFRYTMS
ncbi:hypothetical protein C8F04DRAFT_1181018 [Mycena alexandri]|uniref:Uncharacterized protein n=1 Tax=Mycena alexandri TaxID=1745969 RepID=A0AAD6T082_9AGAR|nr:hypothetical protein C8F04DRAFT_1181018 [Mycena alexandri]